MQWYTKDYVLTHVAQVSPYLNSLSKTYIDIYLKYLNKKHAKYTSCLFNKSSIHSKTSINKNIVKYYYSIFPKIHVKIENIKFIAKTMIIIKTQYLFQKLPIIQ